jgi:hypothetical protein
MRVNGQHHAPAAVPIGQKAGWAPEPVWTQRLEKKPSASVGDRTPVVQSVTILTELPRLLLVQYTLQLKESNRNRHSLNTFSEDLRYENRTSRSPW